MATSAGRRSDVLGYRSVALPRLRSIGLVIAVGDERAWNHAAFRWLDSDDSTQPVKTDERNTYVMILRPMIDRLTRTVHDGRAKAATSS